MTTEHSTTIQSPYRGLVNAYCTSAIDTGRGLLIINTIVNIRVYSSLPKNLAYNQNKDYKMLSEAYIA